MNIDILNGDVDTKFVDNIYEYNVDVEDFVSFLLFEYSLPDNYHLNVVGNNNFSSGKNYVFFEVDDGAKVSIYTFIVNKKEEAKEVLLVNDDASALEINSNQYINKTYFIIVSCLILIFLSFKLIFHKKTKISKS